MDADKKKEWKKTLTAVLILVLVIALPIGIIMTATRRNIFEDETRDHKTQKINGKTQENERPDSLRNKAFYQKRKERMSADFLAIKKQIQDSGITISIAEQSFANFVAVYGLNISESEELRNLVKKRKDAETKAKERQAMMLAKADELKARISDPEESVGELKAEFSDFSSTYKNQEELVSEIKTLWVKRQKLEKEKARELEIVKEARELLGRIHSDQEDIKEIEAALSTFIIHYGEDRKEIPELRRLVQEHKKAIEEAAFREKAIVDEVRSLRIRLKNPEENLQELEVLLGEFIDQHGGSRKEVPELQGLLQHRKETEKREREIAAEAEKLVQRIHSGNWEIADLESDVSEFIRKYETDRKEVPKLKQLLLEREELEKREKKLAASMKSLMNQIVDETFSVDDLEQALQKFIASYGKERKEIGELTSRIEKRKKLELEAKRRRVVFLKEAKALRTNLKDKSQTLEYLSQALEALIKEHGADRQEVRKLQVLFENRKEEAAIITILKSLDDAVLNGDKTKIHSIVHGNEYAEKVIALSEWPELVFHHNLESFERHDQSVEIEVKIDHAVEDMPKTELYYRYDLIKTSDAWVIKNVEKIEN